MNRYYEEKLPEGYSETFVIDANDKKQGMRLQAAVIIIAAALINVFFFTYALPRLGEIAAGFTIIKCICFVIAYPLYIVLHELTHGLAYKLLTRKKLMIRFKPPSAYCGIPDLSADSDTIFEDCNLIISLIFLEMYPPVRCQIFLIYTASIYALCFSSEEKHLSVLKAMPI